MKVLAYPYDRKNFQLAIIQASRTGEPYIIERIDTEPIVVMTVDEYNGKVAASDRIEMSDELPLTLSAIWEKVESMDGELHVRVVHR